jgi:hypothetical protein
MRNELEWIWKEAVGLIEVISRQFPGGNEDNHENLSLYSLYQIDIQAQQLPNKFKTGSRGSVVD